MEEEPTMAAPKIETISEQPDVPENPEIPEIPETPDIPEDSTSSNDEFDLSDITHNPKELSKEEIIAAAEAAAFAEQ